MGRRSSHTPAELRQLILQSSREIIEEDGLEALSARAIAKRIGYSPGTLYNVFKNLDDLLMTLQIAMLEEVTGALREVKRNGSDDGYVLALCERYIGFAISNRQRWNLLFQNHLSPAKPPRDFALDASYETMISLLRDALRPIMKSAEGGDLDRAARVVWISLHGITGLAVTEKTGILSTDTAGTQSAYLLETFIAGLDRVA